MYITIEFSDVLTIIGLLFSIYSIYNSRKANKIAKEANDIAKEQKRIERAPKLKITKAFFDSEKLEIYAGKDVQNYNNNVKKLNNDLYTLIKNTREKESIVDIKGKKYQLINLCSDKIEENKTILIVGAISFEIEVSNGSIVNLHIDKRYSKIPGAKEFEGNMSLDVHINVKNNTIIMPIAYAGASYLTTSLDMNGIIGLKNSSKSINLLEKNDIIDSIFSLSECGYLYRCQTAEDEEYNYTLFMKKEHNRLSSYIVLGESEYEEKLKKSGVGKGVVADYYKKL